MRFISYYGLPSDLLIEGKIEHIAKNQGAKLLARFEKDPSSKMPEWAGWQKHRKQSDAENGKPERNNAEAIVEWFSDYVSKKFLQWVINRYIAEDFLMEDAPRVQEAVERIDELKDKLPAEHKDVNRFKTLSDLEDALDNAEGLVKELEKEETPKDKEFYKDGGAEKIHDGDGFRVIIPKTKAAAINFGRGTKWCTSSNQPNATFFDTYSKQSPLYVIFTSDGNKYQFHFKTLQFMNEKDHPIENWDELLKKYPKLRDVFEKQATEAGFIPLVKKLTADVVENYLQKSYDSPGTMSAKLAAHKPLPADVKELLVNQPHIGAKPTSKRGGRDAVERHSREQSEKYVSLIFIRLGDQFDEDQLLKILSGDTGSMILKLNGLFRNSEPAKDGLVQIAKKHPKFLAKIIEEVFGDKEKSSSVSYDQRRAIESLIEVLHGDKKSIDNIPEEHVMKIVDTEHKLLQYFPDLSDEKKLELIRKDKDLFKYIKNPTNRMKDEYRWAGVKKKDHERY